MKALCDTASGLMWTVISVLFVYLFVYGGAVILAAFESAGLAKLTPDLPLGELDPSSVPAARN